MSVKLVIALLMVAASIFATTFVAAEDAEPFESYPHIRCEACLAIMSEIGEKMNETAKVKTSVQASHRLEGGNERRVDYESSELRAVEILDRICETFFNTYFLRINQTTTRRYFSKVKEDKRAPFYGKNDKAILGAPSRKLQQFCSLMMDEHDDVVTRAIMKERTLDALQDVVCYKKLGYCSNTKAIEKSLAKEDKFRKAHHKLKEKKRLKKLAEQRKKAEEEEAKKKAEEEAAAKQAAEEGTATAPTATTGEEKEPATATATGSVSTEKEIETEKVATTETATAQPATKSAKPTEDL